MAVFSWCCSGRGGTHGLRLLDSPASPYAEIDGQKVVFDSRYLEYADVAANDFWDWSGIAATLGEVWTHADF